MKQPQVARLELGEVNPNIDTLIRISAALGIELTIDVLPAGAPARNVTKRAQANNVVGSVRTDEAELVVSSLFRNRRSDPHVFAAALTSTPA